jgi:hypothetical protein
MVACETHLKNFTEAQKHGELLVEVTRSRYRRDPNSVFGIAWSLLQLSDIYRATNQQDKLLALRGELRPLLQALVEMRALFDAVSSPDKTLFLSGLAEHLIFENPSPDPLLIDTVDSWLRQHIPAGLPKERSGG